MPALDPTVLLGSQYYVNTGDSPEQIRAGIAAMARAGLKLVRIFLQWTHVEPRQGQWDWRQYDALFDAASEGGLGVVVTLTALHPPGWMKISFSPQDLGPLDDPLYMQRARDYIQHAARRYTTHPALHSWILTNEPTLFLPRDEAVLRRYRRFIEQKYGGDIEALNRRAFQQLDSFDELGLPGQGSESGFSDYTGKLDWLDFTVYRLLEILAEIKETLRAAGDTHPVHVNPHNLAGDIYWQGQSIWAEGRLVDFIGCSAHPSWHSVRFLPGRLHQSVAFFSDLMRGATRDPQRHFWVTELQGGANIYSGATYLGPSGADLRSWVWEALGAGAKAVVFWCFNARTSGFEAGEWGLVDQQNRPSPRLDEIARLAAFLHSHQAVFARSRPSRASLAILFSEATFKLGSIEGHGADPLNPRTTHMGPDALVGAWMACADAGLSVDFIDEIDLQNGLAQDYPALILPGCTALEDASLPALRAYVEAGGALLADGLCGYKDPHGWLRPPGGNPLDQLFQAAIADIQAVPASQVAWLQGQAALPVWFLKVALEPGLNGQTLATFAEPAPRPALVEAAAGRGRTLRLGTVFFQHYFQHPDPAAFAGLLAWLALPAGPVRLCNPSAGLRLRRLGLPEGDLLVLLNGGEQATARLEFPPGCLLARLAENGEQPLETGDGSLEIELAAQSAVCIRYQAHVI